MGTVHGVYLKYVGLSALSYAGLTYLTKNPDGSKLSVWELLGYATKSLAGAMPAGRTLVTINVSSMSLWRSLPALVLGYSTILNGLIAVLFKMEIGMGLIGKDRKTGRIPAWSYFLFFPFHGPTLLYTYLHKLKDSRKVVQDDGKLSHKVPVATQVQPGWWVGGCYGHELDKDWAAVIDLTVEFPESAIHRTRAYLSLPTWDGVPASPAQLDQAANFAVQAAANGGGDVLVHCAHGRGRSTTIMCACLVKAGLFATWEEAFEQGIKPSRPVCKLNRRMRQNLTEWQDLYVDDRYKKGQ